MVSRWLTSWNVWWRLDFVVLSHLLVLFLHRDLLFQHLRVLRLGIRNDIQCGLCDALLPLLLHLVVGFVNRCDLLEDFGHIVAFTLQRLLIDKEDDGCVWLVLLILLTFSFLVFRGKVLLVRFFCGSRRRGYLTSDQVCLLRVDPLFLVVWQNLIERKRALHTPLIIASRWCRWFRLL